MSDLPSRARVAGIVALLLGLVAASCTPSTGDTLTGDVFVRVPNVVGMDYDQAEEWLEQAGFKVERRDKVGDHATGVRRQDPDADAAVSPGATVTLTVVSPPRVDPPSEETPADRSWAHGVVIGPSLDWVQGGTVTLWTSTLVSPMLHVVIVHAPHGFYALDLRGVRPCPPDNSGSGEGEEIDKATGDVVFHCANGDVWARFDWFGQSVPGAPARLTRPAYAVRPNADGRLVITRRPPPMPLPDYWRI